MATLTPARRWLALLALALGGFGIGTTEFVAMGLLPNMARDLLPALYAAAPARAVATSGWLISAYALGVVVGAPTFAVLSVRMSRTRLLLALVGVFILGTVASALLPSFGWVLAARFVAALPHGAFFGTAALVAGRILGPGNRGKGIAFVLSGLTVANVVGVPLITRLGQLAGWRVAYLCVAAIFALTLVAIVLCVPRQPASPTASIRAELRVFRKPQLWLMMAVGAVGFAGFFAVYSYVAEVVRQEAHLSESFVPWLLVAIGLGMTVGNLFGGWAADKNLNRTLRLGFPVFIASMAAFALTAGSPVALIVCGFAVGASNLALIPAVQTRLIAVSAEAEMIGAALVHSALNLGNSLGAVLGGAAIAAGWGYRAPTWVGVVLGTLGFGLLILSLRADRTPPPAPAGEHARAAARDSQPAAALAR
ncbi:MAG: transporter [Friedmanniella sp.]|jgi:DHA1 family inner membrane transport protein|nr:transporter [Friedmanniella sp.]